MAWFLGYITKIDYQTYMTIVWRHDNHSAASTKAKEKKRNGQKLFCFVFIMRHLMPTFKQNIVRNRSIVVWNWSF